MNMIKLPDFITSFDFTLVAANCAYIAEIHRLLDNNRENWSKWLPGIYVDPGRIIAPKEFEKYYLAVSKNLERNVVGLSCIKQLKDDVMISQAVDKNFARQKIGVNVLQLLEDAVFENNPFIKNTFLYINGKNQTAQQSAIRGGYKTDQIPSENLHHAMLFYKNR